MSRAWCVLSLLCIFSIVQAKEIYVAPFGITSDPCGNITQPCSSLSLAFEYIESGDTVILLPGNYTGDKNSNLQLKTSLSIIGQNGHEETRINLAEVSTFLTIESGEVSLTGITFDRGLTSGHGGALSLNSGALHVDDCHFYNNTAVSGNGGAIYADHDTTLTVNNSRFSHNYANKGAAVYTRGSALHISHSVFWKNTGHASGAIDSSAKTFNLSHSNFTHNAAGGHGGAVSVAGSRHHFFAVEFRNNTADQEGGCVYNTASSLHIIDSILDFCGSEGNGGAIYADSGSGVVCHRCTITNNVAINNGAAIYCGSAFLNITSSLVSNNQCVGFGGAATLSFCHANFTNSIVTNNAAGDGAGMYLQYTSNLGLENTTLSHNYGNALFCSNSKIWIHACDLSNNTDTPIFCASFPSYTWCTITGDAPFSSQCGEPAWASSSNPFGLPLIAIIGICLGGIGLIICIISAGVCISWRRQAKKGSMRKDQKGLWKKVATNPDEEDNELLNDYDE